MSEKNLAAILQLFIVTVLMVTFSWMGLADYTWLKTDSMENLPKKSISKAQLSSTALLPLKMLENSNRVDSRRVGVSGSTSKNYKAFIQLITHPDAESAFEYLLNSKNIASKIYALHGLKQINPSRYLELRPYFDNSNTEVHVTSGCSGYFKSVTDSLEFIEQIHPDLAYEVSSSK